MNSTVLKCSNGLKTLTAVGSKVYPQIPAECRENTQALYFSSNDSLQKLKKVFFHIPLRKTLLTYSGCLRLTPGSDRHGSGVTVVTLRTPNFDFDSGSARTLKCR